MDVTTRWEAESIRRARRPKPGSHGPDPGTTRSQPAPSEAPADEPGTLLVPLDAWQRMLDQLGNLHQAGQQLAEASARAARAETEVEFLRERVTDLRRQLSDAAHEPSISEGDDQSGTITPGAGADEDAADAGAVATAAHHVKALIGDLRRRRRRR